MLDIFKRAIRRTPLLYSLYRGVYVPVFHRFSKREVYTRYRLVHALKKLSALITREGLTGGLMTGAGDYYLCMPDGIFLFYNYSHAEHSLGDGQSLEFKETHTLPELELYIKRVLSNEAVYFDVGANNGYFYSLKVAREYSKCRIYAFEPDSRIRYALKKNVEFNRMQNINIAPIALADFAGIGKMPARQGASGYLVHAGDRVADQVEVEVNTLDNYVKEQDIERLDLIKVDIEGGEYDFLKGGKSALMRFRPSMIVELQEELLRRSHASAQDIAAFFEDLDYVGYHILGSNDALFIPREKAAELSELGSKWLNPV